MSKTLLRPFITTIKRLTCPPVYYLRPTVHWDVAPKILNERPKFHRVVEEKKPPPKGKAPPQEDQELDLGTIPKDMLMEYFDIPKPKKSVRSAYVAVEKNGTIYHLFDASKISYGRMCTRIAYYLQGKANPYFRRDVGGFGDVCVIVNASNTKMLGRRKTYRLMRYHTGFVGGLQEIPYKRMLEEKPEQLIHFVVSKMLPKNRLRADMLKNLKVYREDHDMTDILPNFLPDKPVYIPLVHDDPLSRINKDSVVIYETNKGESTIAKDLPRVDDLDIFNPYPPTAKYSHENRITKKKMQRLKQLELRYKERKIKPKKNNDPRLKDSTYFIRSERKLKKYHLNELAEFNANENEDEEDDTMK